MDESTNISKMPQIKVFDKFCFSSETNGRAIFCKPLKGRFTTEAVFSTVNYLFNKNVFWKRCASVKTSGTAVLTGIREGSGGRVM